jgi:transposase-like protein
VSSQIGRLALQDVIEQGWKQLQGGFLQQLKKTIEGLLTAERDRRVAERQERGEKIYRWGYTVRKCWQTAWGALEQVRVPRLRGREEIGLLEKYQRHALQEVLFALAVGGLSQRKVVSWVRRFLGGQLSPASIGAVLRAAQEQIQARREQRLCSGTYRALAVDGIYLRYRRSAESQARKGVLLVAVGVREGGGFEVLEWMAAAAETSQAYEELFTRLWRRGLEQVELVISDGAEGAASAAALVYPAAAHQLCLAHWFRNLEGLTPPLQWWQRKKFRREFWWIFEAEQETQLRKWAGSFARRWRFWAPEMVQKFQEELPGVLAYLRFPRYWRHRLRTTNLAEGFFRHLRRYLSRFPGCVDAVHSEQVLGCYLLAAERMHA